MSPAALLARARGLGIRVAEESGGLRVEGHALSDDLVAEIRAAKPTLLALLRREAARAVEADVPNPAPPGPPWDRRAPWSWTDPANTPEDQAILRAIEGRDGAPSTETRPDKARMSCYGCGTRDWWRARHGGHLVCRRCHPPVPGAELAALLAVAGAAGAKECA
ncbi:MAG: hypothetical protein JNM10_07075 [Planctomycetia bacterium]|nr:hypothetical protein [Planctomycetia bacterium]